MIASWQGNYENLDCVKKQRCHDGDTGPYNGILYSQEN